MLETCPVFFTGNTLKGAIVEEYPFTLNIAEVPEPKSFNGTVDWPTLDTITKVRGYD
jgi:hypothetical protein